MIFRVMVLGCLLAVTHRAVSATEIYRTAAQPESAPKYTQMADGRIGGLCVELFRLMEQQEPALRIEGDQHFIPLKRLEKRGRFGQLDFLCGVGDNPVRRNHFLYLQPPIFTVRYHLAVRSDDPVEIHHWDDVRALGNAGIILVNHGCSAIERLQAIQGLIIDSGGSSSAANYDKLLMKRGRFVYYRSPGIEADLQRHHLSDQIRILPVAMETIPFYILFYQRTSPARLALFTSTLQRLADRGELARLAERYP